MSVRHKVVLRRYPGRPRKYLLAKTAYKDAVYRHRHPSKQGRPRRGLVNTGRGIGLMCIQCNKVKPVTEFWFADARRLCLESMCKGCKRKYARERQSKQK